jgi:phage shock protein C
MLRGVRLLRCLWLLAMTGKVSPKEFMVYGRVQAPLLVWGLWCIIPHIPPIAGGRAMTRRLYRNRDDRVIAGVCGGLGAYFGIDPAIVRVIAVLSIFAGGTGIIAYLVLAIIVPLEGSSTAVPKDTIKENVGDIRETASAIGRDIQSTVAKDRVEAEEETTLRSRRMNWLGIAVIVFGVVLLLGNFNLFRWFNLGLLWPIPVIAIGLLLLIAARRK